jgi:hypothetical protein
MDITINYGAVLAASIASFAVGALWYTVLFGKPWRKLMGVAEDAQGKMPMWPMLVGFVMVLLMVYVLAHFAVLFNAKSTVDALAMSFWVWVGFQAPLLANSVLYEKRPLTLYVINAAHQLVAVLVAGLVLSLF